jgi:hypothetical protein
MTNSTSWKLHNELKPNEFVSRFFELFQGAKDQRGKGPEMISFPLSLTPFAPRPLSLREKRAKFFRVAIATCVLFVLACYGCASRPDEQIKTATDAMNQAIEQRADQYAPGDWKSAKEMWDQAQNELAAQKYAAAAQSFLRARARLLKVYDIAKAERESMQKVVTDIKTNIDSSYPTLKAAINAAKLTGAAKKEFQAACADIDKRIEILTSLMNEGDYIQAKTAAQQTLQAIYFSQKKLQERKTS